MYIYICMYIYILPFGDYTSYSDTPNMTFTSILVFCQPRKHIDAEELDAKMVRGMCF